MMSRRKILHLVGDKYNLLYQHYRFSAHMMAPDNLDILASLAQSLLQCGNHEEAQKCAKMVLVKVIILSLYQTSAIVYKDPNCVKAVIAKAESLYNTCDFEHALVLFIRGQFLAPDLSIA